MGFGLERNEWRVKDLLTYLVHGLHVYYLVHVYIFLTNKSFHQVNSKTGIFF